MTAAQRERVEEALFPPVVAILIAFVAGDILMLSFNQSPLVVWRLLLDGSWGNAYGFGQVMYKATTLSFTGMAVAFAYRAGLFNIGGEGQLAAADSRRRLWASRSPSASRRLSQSCLAAWVRRLRAESWARSLATCACDSARTR